MASFTDAISQFNPYVQQLPVELMAKVGMQKQAQYDAGVQKIQQQIDNVSGIDVANSADKSYLTSKLNQLGDNIKIYAAGDFSNQQLVNSVGGMANQLVKDPVVQQAVISTQNYKKGLQEMEKARKEGKIGASNEYVFNQKASEYLNSKEPGKAFNSTYTPYRDVNAKVLDVIGKLHPNAEIKNIPYVINPDGSVNINKVADALTKQGVKSVSAGQIKTAVNSMLDANDLNQLQIDGQYNFRNLNKEDLIIHTTNQYENTKNQYVKLIDGLNKQLATISDPNQQDEIKSQIKEYQNALGDPYEDIEGTLKQNYNRTLEIINSDPDYAKGSIYKQKYLDQIANGFAYKEISQELTSNPMRDVQLKLMDIDHARRTLNETIAEHSRVNKRFYEGLDWDKQKEFMKSGTGKAPTFDGSGDETTDKLKSYQNYLDYTGRLVQDNGQILTSLAANEGTVVNPISPAQIKEKIKNYESGKYTPSSDEKVLFDKYIRNENFKNNFDAVVDIWKNEGLNKFKESEGLDKDLRLATTLKVSGETITPTDVTNLLSKKSMVPGIRGTLPTYYFNKNNLSDRDRLVLEKLGGKNFEISMTYNGIGKSGNPTTDKWLESISELTKVNVKRDKFITNHVADKLANITGQFKTEVAGIAYEKDNDKDNFLSKLAAKVQADKEQEVGGINYDADNVLSSLNPENRKNLVTAFKRKGDQNFIVIKDGSDVHEVPVSNDWVVSDKNLGANYVNNNIDKAQTLLAGGGKTNMFGDAKHAYYSEGSIGSEPIKYHIKADLRKGTDGQVYPIFWTKTKSNNWIPLKYKTPTDPGLFESSYLSTLTNSKVENLFRSMGVNIDNLETK